VDARTGHGCFPPASRASASATARRAGSDAASLAAALTTTEICSKVVKRKEHEKSAKGARRRRIFWTYRLGLRNQMGLRRTDRTCHPSHTRRGQEHRGARRSRIAPGDPMSRRSMGFAGEVLWRARGCVWRARISAVEDSGAEIDRPGRDIRGDMRRCVGNVS
jgi:hypothetical protein